MKRGDFLNEINYKIKISCAQKKGNGYMQHKHNIRIKAKSYDIALIVGNEYKDSMYGSIPNTILKAIEVIPEVK